MSDEMGGDDEDFAETLRGHLASAKSALEDMTVCVPINADDVNAEGGPFHLAWIDETIAQLQLARAKLVLHLVTVHGMPYIR
jgi:hypothetical protein